MEKLAESIEKIDVRKTLEEAGKDKSADEILGERAKDWVPVGGANEHYYDTNRTKQLHPDPKSVPVGGKSDTDSEDSEDEDESNRRRNLAESKAMHDAFSSPQYK